MSLKLCDRISTDPYSTAPTILLIGRTGSGKSTLANMLIGEEKFKTSDDSYGTCTNICQNTLINLNGKEYNLVDTPGVFDVISPDDEVLGEIAQSIVKCSHGIIAILFVMAAGRYTEEQQITTETILKFLGREESCRHIIVVFTKCRKKQTNDRFLMEDSFNDNLKSFLNKVGNRWVISPDPEIFDNPNDPVVERHMNDLKTYIGLMPKPYTTNLFWKIRIAREKKLLDIEMKIED